MNLLLDTHAFLWFIANDPRLSPQAQSLMQAPANRRLLSLVVS
jgi:PIN domain nuclease of toxin-antitoxin system